MCAPWLHALSGFHALNLGCPFSSCGTVLFTEAGQESQLLKYEAPQGLHSSLGPKVHQNHSRNGGAISRMNTRVPPFPWSMVRGVPPGYLPLNSITSNVVPQRLASDQILLCCSIPSHTAHQSALPTKALQSVKEGGAGTKIQPITCRTPTGPSYVHLDQGGSVSSQACTCQKTFFWFPQEFCPLVSLRNDAEFSIP